MVMSRHEPFTFQSGPELLRKAGELGGELPFQDSVSPLFECLAIGSKTLANRLAVQPMEGFDADTDGSPGELTFRRYRRYAEGGCGLIWFEATSVVPEGRSNPHQLMLHPRNLDSFKRLVDETRRSSQKVFGSSHEIFLVLQLTHSGRYSQPEGQPLRQVADFNPNLDRKPEDVRILSDDELDRYQDKYVEVARLAEQAGFDAVDIKACHGYLVNELLAARTRESSRYGETFENRILFLSEVIQKIRDRTPGLCLAVRLSAFDGIPGGFGVFGDNPEDIDLSEPKELVRQLAQSNCSFFNITVGNPYEKPHLGRPFDRPLQGASLPEEHPLEGIARLMRITAIFQKEFPDIPFVGTGYSWLRHFFPNVGAAVLQRGEASLIGLGRSSFAYPDAPRDLMSSGALDSGKVCISCSRCTELMRNGYESGCVMRDKEIYGKLYQKLVNKRKKNEENND
jgi:2,4-dienoyl-CoA reductase (NADPH2)